MSEPAPAKNMRKGLGAIWRHLQPFRKEVVVLVVLGLISAGANALTPFVTGRFFDGLIALSNGHSELFRQSIPLWLVLLTLWSINQLIVNHVDWLMDRRRRDLDSRVHFNVQIDGFAHLLRLPLAYHKNAHINGVLHKIGQASWRIAAVIRIVINVAPELLSLIVGIILAATISVQMALVLLAGVGVYLILLGRILGPMAQIDHEAHETWNSNYDDAAAAVNQIESVKQAATEDYEIRKVTHALGTETLTLWDKLERHWSNVSFYQRIIVFFTQFTIFVLSVKLVSSGAITVGQLITLNGYAMMFFGPFVQLGSSWQTIQNGITTAEQAEEVFKEKLEDYHPTNTKALASNPGNIKLENVSFAYSADQSPVLKNINLEIKAGEVVALVGESGVGKSTTISLISGYYFPTAGRVTVGGVDTRELDLTNLRQQIAVVPQEVALFNDTIKTNIKYGSFAATDAEVEAAARKAHALDFIEKFPEKWEQVVGERGIKLSVGQKQRVAIARAILRDPKILILDEPTSALDAQTEKIIQTSLEELMRGRTTFIIAHRLSTVRRADKILVFKDGEIVEAGKHDELVKIPDGVYHRLYELQIGLHD